MALFDTAGMERFTYTIPPTYFRHAKVVVLVYAVDNIDSVTNLTDWVTNFHSTRIGDSSLNMIRVLVGNKSDLDESETIRRMAEEMARMCEVPDNMRFEISAKTGKGFDAMFTAIAGEIANMQVTIKPRARSITVTNPDSEEQKKKPFLSCCRSQ